MKIGIDIRSIGRQQTGNETYTTELVRHLLRIDKADRFNLYTDTEDPKIIRNIESSLGISSDNEQVKITPVLPESKALWTFYSLPKYLFKDPVDVLHVQYITPQILPKKIKLVTTIHDISFNFFPQFIKKFDLLFLKTLIPLSIKRADKIIGVSEFTKKEIVDYYKTDSEKIVAIPNSVSQEFFSKVSDEDIAKVKAKYDLPSTFILYVGTLQPRKNIPFMIEGFKQLKTLSSKAEIKDLKLVIVGNRRAHNYDKGIDQVMKNLSDKNPGLEKDIVFPGFIEEQDLTAVYQASTVFCFPSLYEGFGLPIIEAMASGVPVVCSNSSCLPEVAKEAAMIFEKDNMADFVSKVIELASDDELRANLREKGFKQAKTFSWEKAANATLAVYQDLNK